MTNDMALTTYEEVSKIGAAMVKSGFFKSATNEAQAIVQIWAGRELGIGAVEALRGIHIIDGHISLSAGLVAAQVKRSHRYNYRVKVQTAVACEIEWYEEKQPIGISAFTIQEAAAAGLATKQVWKSYPSDMLFARALTRGARRFCPDVFGGSVYTSEELGAADAIEGDYEVQADTEPVAPPAPPPASSTDASESRADIDAALATAGITAPELKRYLTEGQGIVKPITARLIREEAVTVGGLAALAENARLWLEAGDGT